MNRFAAARLSNVGGRIGALRTAFGPLQFRDFYSLSDGSQSSIGLPSGSLSHAKVPLAAILDRTTLSAKWHTNLG